MSERKKEKITLEILRNLFLLILTLSVTKKNFHNLLFITKKTYKKIMFWQICNEENNTSINLTYVYFALGTNFIKIYHIVMPQYNGHTPFSSLEIMGEKKVPT